MCFLCALICTKEEFSMLSYIIRYFINFHDHLSLCRDLMLNKSRKSLWLQLTIIKIDLNGGFFDMSIRSE